MRQLVGLSCVNCGERIKCVVDGCFCQTCGCPVHTACARPATSADEKLNCVTCGSDAEHWQREQQINQEHERRDQVRLSRPSSRALVCGIIGFSIMTFRGLISTLDPKPDGRLFNTAPLIGVDVSLVIGLLGIGYLIYRANRR